MDRTFRLVWNDSSKTLTMADGWFGGSSKRLLVRSAALAVALSGMWGGAALAGAPAATALPTGAQVAAGQVAITTTPSTMNVVQASSKAVINWQSFNVGADAAVNFSQPGKDAVALNRVLGHDPSAIYGKLTANGQVFLINPNGVLFAPGAQVNVGALVASTLDISDQDFLTGTYRFNRDGSSGAVVNEGALSAGYVALLGSRVSNRGVISAPMGTVALASGEAVTLGITGQNLVSVQVDKASIDTLVQNNGLIQVDGGVALLSAQSATDLLGQVVNTGEISANGIESDGGVIRLTASSNIDHSGVLSADAGLDGNGGSVSVIAALDNPASLTRVSGAISARGGAESGDGGSVETSASRLKIADTARVDTTAPNGATGAWLLDPYDFTIAGANGDITGATLSAALASSDVIIATADTSVSCTGADCGSGDSSGNGDIHVNDAVSWSEAHTLTLSAWNNVNINAPISVSGSGGLALEFAQSDIAANFPSGNYFVNAPVNLAATASFSTKAGSDGPVISYTVITDPTTLAALSSNLGGAFVLGGDVDLSAIASWTPLGTLVSPFAGYFDGLGHEVTGLTHVNSGADTEVGLFGANVGQIQNVGITGVNVAGSQNVGALVGFNNGVVVNSYATGSVTGSGASNTAPVGGIGGLVGYSAGPIFQSYADVTVSATSGDQSSGSPLGTFVDPHGTGGIGGLTGVATSGVTASYATGAVTGNHAVGGLVGYSAASIQSTYSTGLVTGATINAVAATDLGGLIGAVDQPSSPFPFIFSSFWDVETSGQATSAGGLGDAGNVVGLTTSQMKTASTFTGDWTTSGAWELRDGEYPLLTQMLQPIFVIADNQTTTYNGSAVTGFISTIAPAGLGSNYSGTVTVTPSTASPTDAGSYTLTPSGLSLTSPGDQHGYRLEYVEGVLTIDPAPLRTTITGSLQGDFTKTYDGTTVADGLTPDNFLLTGWQGSDGATVSKTTGEFDDANAGTGKTITVTLTSSDYTASGSTNLSNYILPTSVSGAIGTIDQAPLSVSLQGDFTKTYDSALAADGLSVSNFNLTGWQGSDGGTVTATSGVFDDANAGTGKTITVTLGSSDFTASGSTTLSNYILPTSASGSIGSIDQAQLSVSLQGTFTKTYDSTVAADGLSASNFELTGWQGSDGGTVTATSGVFDNADAGTGKTITVTLGAGDFTASGSTTLSNYILPTSASGSIGTVDKAVLTGSLTGAFSKTYDASDAADGLTASNFNLTGWQGSDGATVTATSGVFDDANAGTGKTITVNLASGDFTASGSTKLSNYTLPTEVEGAIGAINKAPLGVTVTKTYDGSDSFTTGFTFTGMVGDEAAPTVTSGSATVASADAGAYTSFATDNLVLSDANYTLDGGTVSATIAQKALDAELTGTFSKTYDSTADADGLGTDNFSLSGWVGDDGATVTKTSGEFDDANAATGKTITVTLADSDFDPAGTTNLSNYILPTEVEGAIGTVTPKALDVLTLSQPIYIAGTPEFPVQVSVPSGATIAAGTGGLLPGDGPLTVTGSALWDADGQGSGNTYPVTLHPGEEENLHLSGPGAGNYTLTGTSVSATIKGSAYPMPSVSSVALKSAQIAVYQIGSQEGKDWWKLQRSEYTRRLKHRVSKKYLRMFAEQTRSYGVDLEEIFQTIMEEYSDSVDTSLDSLTN